VLNIDTLLDGIDQSYEDEFVAFSIW